MQLSIMDHEVHSPEVTPQDKNLDDTVIIEGFNETSERTETQPSNRINIEPIVITEHDSSEAGNVYTGMFLLQISSRI